MSIADAIVYLLATSNCGMRSEQVYAVCMANKGVFCKDGGLIRLLM